jgi:hypothetical protein
VQDLETKLLTLIKGYMETGFRIKRYTSHSHLKNK